MDREQSLNQQNNEVIMLPLSEITSIKWTIERGRNLKSLRGQMSLQDLAERVGICGYKVSRQYLNRLESDPTIKGASPEMLRAICEALGVSLSTLLNLPYQKILQLGGDNRN